MKLVSVGRGGWTAYESPKTRVSGTGALPAEYADGAEILVDTRAIQDYRMLAVFAFDGPVVDVSVPPGMISRLYEGLVPWVAVPLGLERAEERKPLGNARGFDAVGAELYAHIAERFGARVTRRALASGDAGDDVARCRMGHVRSIPDPACAGCHDGREDVA